MTVCVKSSAIALSDRFQQQRAVRQQHLRVACRGPVVRGPGDPWIADLMACNGKPDSQQSENDEQIAPPRLFFSGVAITLRNGQVFP